MRLRVFNNTFSRFGFLLLILLIGFTSCEDVIDVEVDSITPRLVVEADIEWEKGTDGSQQSILLSQSTDFFDESFAPVGDASVSIRNMNSGNEFVFAHEGQGTYSTNDFLPILNDSYELVINHNGETYRSTEVFTGVPEVNRVEQNTSLGFDGEDVVRIDFYANDPLDEANYFYVTHAVNNDTTPYISIWDDEFQQGNELRFFYSEFFDDDQEEIVAGDVIDIEFMGISEDYYDYMILLTEQAYGGGDPFASTPVPLQGNVINESDLSRNAFGFFRLSEKSSFSITVE